MKHTLMGLILAVTLFASRAMAIEEPAFTSVLKEGAYEIRDYQAVTVAEVEVSGAQKEAASKGFRLLAAYIFGGNTRRQGIAMTAPVTQQPPSERIEMTAPVVQTQHAGNWIVQFTMPRAYSLASLPQPNDSRVHLRALPAARMAVLRFSGLAREEDVRDKTAELTAFTKARHLHAIGPPSLAQYNPPWTPWFMRRNEVLIPIGS